MSEAYADTRAGRLDHAVQALLAQSPDLEAAAVVSFDGLPMASALPAGMHEDRVAAMSAALLSLGERAAAGLGRGELSQVYIEGDAGTVFLVSAEDEAVLVAVAAKGAKAGMMLYEVRRAATLVAEVLRADDAAQAEPAQNEVAQADVAQADVGQADVAQAETAAARLPEPSPAPVPPQPAPAPAPAAEPSYASAEPAGSGWSSYAPLVNGSLLPGEPPRWS